ncbi:Bsd2p [Rhodotorula paludigena]|uniref:Bsd2p n=1 Tax=Rhodotorula paludigena TaxID=86838 RepID=UPI00317D845B
MVSLFGRTAARPYAHPASHAPDYDAFAAPDDDSDTDDDDHDGRRTSLDGARGQVHGAHTPGYSLDSPAHPLASSSSRSTSASPRPASPPAPLPALPGAYDFEPQTEHPRAPAGAPAAYSHHARLAHAARQAPASYPLDPDADDDDDDSAGDDALYGRASLGGSAHAAHTRGASLGGWRGLVARLRGDGPDGSGAPRAGESHGLLFSQDESDETDGEAAHLRRGPAATAYPPARPSHLPLPPRAPQFAPPSAASSSSTVGALAGGAAGASAGSHGAAPGARVYGGGQSNDGVFANLAAKPDNPNGLDVVGEGPNKDEVLPPYEAAQLDPSPQYWETTVITPGGGFLGQDDILVDGLPVGNLFSFAWNLLVSMSFQFVGFLLTYILHTTHAAKNGSRAGLGITLIQLGFYIKQRSDHPDSYLDDGTTPSGDETGLNGSLGPTDLDSQRWSWWGGFDDAAGAGSSVASATASALGSLPTQVAGALAHALDASDPDAAGASAAPSPFPTLQGDGVSEDEMIRMSLAANEWLAFVMVTIGSFLLIGSCLAYWRAVRYARAIRQGQGPGADQENVIAF